MTWLLTMSHRPSGLAAIPSGTSSQRHSRTCGSVAVQSSSVHRAVVETVVPPRSASTIVLRPYPAIAMRRPSGETRTSSARPSAESTACTSAGAVSGTDGIRAPTGMGEASTSLVIPRESTEAA